MNDAGDRFPAGTGPARRPGATSGYVPVNGLDMYYEIYGDGSPLALFHGAMGTIDSCFAKLLPALAASSSWARPSLDPCELPAPPQTRPR
jgi:hypothetical protein